MKVLGPLILLVAAATALQNPHRKAASHRQVKPLRKRELTSAPTTHQYLNKQTKSMHELAARGKPRLLTEVLQNSKLTELTFHKYLSISEKATPVCCPIRPMEIRAYSFGSSPLPIQRQTKKSVYTLPFVELILITSQITIWLNGGPGCSSLDGILQENGPFLWQAGVYEPVKNPYSWTKLTNIVYIDQPAGTGLSPGPATVENEIDVANQFNDFWKNFIETFSMQGYKVYITGESYAGQYIPYLAAGMLDRNDTTHYNLKGIQINDPSINDDNVLIYGQSEPITKMRIILTDIESPGCSGIEPLLRGLRLERDVHD